MLREYRFGKCEFHTWAMICNDASFCFLRTLTFSNKPLRYVSLALIPFPLGGGRDQSADVTSRRETQRPRHSNQLRKRQVRLHEIVNTAYPASKCPLHSSFNCLSFARSVSLVAAAPLLMWSGLIINFQCTSSNAAAMTFVECLAAF